MGADFRLSQRVLLRTVGRSVLNLLFPERCFACGDLIDDAGAICADCWAGLSFLGSPCCACCGHPFEYAVPEGVLCGACIRRRPPYESARAAILYDDASRELVLAFKHADRTRFADAFGLWMFRAGAAFLYGADLIVPVPLHRRRLWSRRYNQSLLLARALTRHCGVPTDPDLLRRRRNTPMQGGLSRAARRRNVQAAFAVRPGTSERVRGKTVVLVDDVLTTGATVEACTRVLRAAGASEVHVLTLARVERPRST